MRKLPDHIDRLHPINTGQYAIFTPAVDSFAAKLGDWIDSKITGAYVYGPSRFGKSRAIQYHLNVLLNERFGRQIPLHVWSRPFTQKSPGELYMSILDGFNHGYGGSRGSPNLRLNTLTEFFISRSDRCETNDVYFIVDEAQGMTTSEWGWLLGVQNRLDRHGYSLSVFSVASHQMAYEFDLLARTGNPHVGARFLVDHWNFPGIQSVEELEFILTGYDEDSQWPAEDGCSYLAYFAPQHFELGRRLAAHAPVIWKCLVALLPEGVEMAYNFPIKHVALAVEDALVALSFGRDWSEVTSAEAWVQALTKHRLADHMRAISVDI